MNPNYPFNIKKPQNGIGSELICFDVIDSTNTYAKENAQILKDKTVVISAEQTGGRGRLGRNWVSNKDTGVFMSVLLSPHSDFISKLHLYSFFSAIAVARAVEKSFLLKCSLKWPNDVLANGKKICGILIESVKFGSETRLICGIGVNINNESFPPELEHKASSIFLQTKRKHSLSEFAETLFFELNSVYKTMLADEIFLMQEYEERCLFGEVTVSATGEKGKSFGISQNGALLVKGNSNEGNVMEISSGEIVLTDFY